MLLIDPSRAVLNSRAAENAADVSGRADAPDRWTPRHELQQFIRQRLVAAGLKPHKSLDHALVLETDAPDIAPAWLRGADGKSGRNAPGELARIAAAIATLRGTTLDDLARQTTCNACGVLPRLADVLAHLPAGVDAA